MDPLKQGRISPSQQEHGRSFFSGDSQDGLGIFSSDDTPGSGQIPFDSQEIVISSPLETPYEELDRPLLEKNQTDLRERSKSSKRDQEQDQDDALKNNALVFYDSDPSPDLDKNKNKKKSRNSNRKSPVPMDLGFSKSKGDSSTDFIAKDQVNRQRNTDLESPMVSVSPEKSPARKITPGDPTLEPSGRDLGFGDDPVKDTRSKLVREDQRVGKEAVLGFNKPPKYPPLKLYNEVLGIANNRSDGQKLPNSIGGASDIAKEGSRRLNGCANLIDILNILPGEPDRSIGDVDILEIAERAGLTFRPRWRRSDG